MGGEHREVVPQSTFGAVSALVVRFVFRVLGCAVVLRGEELCRERGSVGENTVLDDLTTAVP